MDTTSLKARYPVAIDDGRGFLPDKIGFAAPAGMREEIFRVATASGLSIAAFVRGAIEDRLRRVSVSAGEA